MNKSMVSVELASPPDREGLVAQIMIGGEQWAEINQESALPVLEIYPRQDGRPWVLGLDEAIGALNRARQRLHPDKSQFGGERM